MEPVLLDEIVACYSDCLLSSAQAVAVGFDLAARDASCLVCHLRFGGGDNSWDLVASAPAE